MDSQVRTTSSTNLLNAHTKSLEAELSSSPTGSIIILILTNAIRRIRHFFALHNSA